MMLKTELLPKVNWAGIITLDPILSIPDFSMGERIFETLQKIGEVAKNKIILQTYVSENYLLKNILGMYNTDARPGPASVSFEKFAEKELKMRKALSFPPFSQIIKISYAHANPQKAEQEAKVLKNKLDLQLNNYKIPASKLQILGPAPAFVPRQKNRYIWQIMLKSKIQDLALRNKLLRVVPSDWKIDVDPIEML